MDCAARTLAQWDATAGGDCGVSLSINLSAIQLQRDEIAPMVEAALATHGVEGRRVTLELTESALIADPDRNAAMLRRVGDVLLPPGDSGVLGPLISVAEAWANAEPETVAALTPALKAAEALFGPALVTHVAPEGLDAFYEHFRCAQAEQAWTALGPWIAATNPKFGPGVKERFDTAAAMDPAKSAAGRAFRRVAQARFHALLGGGALMIYPTSPAPAPLLASSLAEQNKVRERTMGVTAIAGFCGLPEVSIPAGKVAGAPVGLSLVGAPGRDRAVLAAAEALAASLGIGG
jgi:amidase